MGASVSVLGSIFFGSRLSIRSFSRLGSAFSLFGSTSLGNSMSLLGSTCLGAACSLRAFVRLGSSLSVIGTSRVGCRVSVLSSMSCGASMSLRSVARLGSSCSLLGNLKLGASLSVLDFMSFGSSLSLRSFVRFGAALSIGGASAVPFNDHLNLNNGNIRATIGGAPQSPYDEDGITKRISIPGPSGTAALHGTWTTDVSLIDSDRRLKQNIAPLGIDLAKRRELMQGISGAGGSGTKESSVSWFLRQLRPVSFSFKSTTDAKALAAKEQRFGFLAQEVERVAPNLVTNVDSTNENAGTFGLMYKDLLAVLILAFKEQQEQLGRQSADVVDAQQEVSDLLDAADILEKVLDFFEAETADADERS